MYIPMWLQKSVSKLQVSRKDGERKHVGKIFLVGQGEHDFFFFFF
jgi:hypothetical protein